MILVPGTFEVFRWARIASAFLQSGFMFNIALSGNYSFLNWLTMIPCLALLDDQFFGYSVANPFSRIFGWTATGLDFTYFLMDLFGLYLVVTRSLPVIRNLLSSGQIMNTSFDPFALVNTYGAFGSVGKTRNEVIISASHDGENWIEYEFPAKPGDIMRRPCFCAPYHYRLDWNIWFIGFPPHKNYIESRERWIWHFIYKLLNGDEKTLCLLDYDRNKEIYANGNPKYIKCDMYRYKLRSIFDEGRAWWDRKYTMQLIPPVSLESRVLARKLQSYNYLFGIDPIELRKFLDKAGVRKLREDDDVFAKIFGRQRW